MQHINAEVLKLVQRGLFPGRKVVESAVRTHGFSLMDEGMLEAYRLAVKGFLCEGD